MARLIDANALKSEMEYLLKRNDTLVDGWLADRIIEEIEDAPTIEPKHGRWINIKVSTTGESSAECSECGAIVHTTFTSTVNYCPNCGARMDEVENGK